MSPSCTPSPDPCLSTGGPGWHPIPAPQSPTRCDPEVGPLRTVLPFRLPSGSAGCAQWGLCGPSSAECQARLRQASRQGGGGPQAPGRRQGRRPALSSGRAWAGRALGLRGGRACHTITLSPSSVSPQCQGGGCSSLHPKASPSGSGSSPGRPQWPLGRAVPAPWWH